jgi:hypothetical protein
MQLMVQILSFGTAWWVRPGWDERDPERFTRHAAYFNSTGIEVGSKIHTDGPVHGLIRFNFSSGLDPHHTHVNIGRTFCFQGIEWYRETNRLLALHRAEKDVRPTHFLVRVASGLHGMISFRMAWRSDDVQTVAVSRLRGMQELLLLMTPTSHIHTKAGAWRVCQSKTELPRLQLVDDLERAPQGERPR